jgi:hypothetical protein
MPTMICCGCKNSRCSRRSQNTESRRQNSQRIMKVMSRSETLLSTFCPGVWHTSGLFPPAGLFPASPHSEKRVQSRPTQKPGVLFCPTAGWRCELGGKRPEKSQQARFAPKSGCIGSFYATTRTPPLKGLRRFLQLKPKIPVLHPGTLTKKRLLSKGCRI